MKPFVNTLAMAIIAVIASVLAWQYFPKNEVGETNVKIGQPLLEGDTAYETGDVYRVAIQRYDRELDTAKDIELSRVSGSWVIPEKNDFLASNAERISGVIDSLRDKKILDMPSDQQNDHEEFGVVDLTEAGASRTGVGTMLTLEDSRRNPLARIIVGKAADDSSKRFVRFPGQPQIYVIDFDESLLSTEFNDWVDGDLLRFGNQQVQLQQLLESMEIDYYFIDPRKTGAERKPTWVYKARIYPVDGQWRYDLWMPNDQQQLDSEPSITGAALNVDTLRNLFGVVLSFPLRDVQRKPAVAAVDLADPKADSPVAHFDWLATRGFQVAGFEYGQHLFDSLAGEIRLHYRNGNVDTLAIGDLAGLDMQNRSNINRFLLVTCGVDESLMPEPAKPDDGNADDDALRDYQKQLNQRNETLEIARERARSLNQVHADWLYVIPQDAVIELFPPLQALAADGKK